MKKEKFLIIRRSLILRMTTLEEQLMNSGEPERTNKFMEVKTNLTDWISNMESVLLSEQPVINSIPAMEAQLKHFKVIYTS